MVNRFNFPSHIRAALAVFILLIVVGTIFYTIYEGWGILDSIYFTVITLATVGYGDLHPTSDLSKIFTIIYVVIGVSLVLYLFTTITRFFIEDETRELEKIDKRLKVIEKKIED